MNFLESLIIHYGQGFVSKFRANFIVEVLDFHR